MVFCSIVTSSATQQQQRSPLLQCLARIDVDTWARLLLPKLVKQGSATTVVLTCSELRDLCYGAVQHLNLSKVHGSSDSNQAVEDWVQSLPQHFPHCTSVQLQLGQEASYHTTPYLLPALARWVRCTLHHQQAASFCAEQHAACSVGCCVRLCVVQ